MPAPHCPSSALGPAHAPAAPLRACRHRRPVLITLSISCCCAPHLQVWIAPGLGLGDDFIASLSSLSDDSSVVMLAILLVFAIAHSGLAFLRPYGALKAASAAAAAALLLAILLVFAIAHSGLAFLRPYGGGSACCCCCCAAGHSGLAFLRPYGGGRVCCCFRRAAGHPACGWVCSLACLRSAVLQLLAPLLPAMHVGQHSAGTAWRTSIE